MKKQKTVLQVIESVIKLQKREPRGTSNCTLQVDNSVLIVTLIVYWLFYCLCSNTVGGRSGVYCAISNVIEQCETERELDVFQTVKAIRMNKQGIIQTPVGEY